MDMQPASRSTVSARKYEATKSRLESLFSEKDLKVLARFDQAMIIDGLKAGRKCKILDSILAMSKLLDGRQWSELDSDEVKLEPEEVVETTPEYDSGEVDMNALLDDEMESNYDLNTVENTEFEDMLVDAKILGDLPEEIDFE